MGVAFRLYRTDRAARTADAFLVGREFIAGSPVGLILGITSFSAMAGRAIADFATLEQGAQVFAYAVPIPSAMAW